MLGGLRAGGEGDDRKWDGWMASPTQWTWIWVNSRSWWWTGRPSMLQFMGSQRVGHDWETELTDGTDIAGSYAMLLFTASDLASITSHIHNWVLILLWLSLFILSGLISPQRQTGTSICTDPLYPWVFCYPVKLGVLILVTSLVTQKVEREGKWEDALKSTVQFTHSLNRQTFLSPAEWPGLVTICWWMSHAQSCGVCRNSNNNSPPLPWKVRKCPHLGHLDWGERDKLEFAKKEIHVLKQYLSRL